MTCIVGMLDDNGKIWVGGDSAGVAGGKMYVRADEKVFRNGPFLFGFTSSFRMGQLLRYSFVPPKHPSRMTTSRFLHTLFIDEVIKTLKEKGFAQVSDNQVTGGAFIFGYRSGLYTCDSDFQIGVEYGRFSSVGCGESFAYGAFFAMKKSGVLENIGARRAIQIALGAAEAGSSEVRGPFVIRSMSCERP